jgi:DamX protein
MNNFETNRQSPNYLDFYSLDRAPFAEDTDEHFFYASNALTQRLNLLTHLTQFGNSVIIITGPEGSGKTTLLNQFCDHAETGWVLCPCQATQSINLQDLLADRLNGSSSMSVKHLITDWINRTEDSRLLILLVDDAQLLSHETLQELSTCMAAPLNERVRLLLFGTPETTRLLQPSSNEDQLFEQPPQVLEAPLLSEEDTASYLLQRLAMAGYNGDSAFSTTEIRAIYKTSGGLPRETNRLAHNVLEERVAQALSQESPTTKSKNKRPEINIWLSAAALVVAAMLWPFFFSNEPETTDLESSEHALTVPPIAVNDIKTMVERAEPETNPANSPQLAKTPIVAQPEDKEIRDQLQAIPAKDTQPELAGASDLEMAIKDYKLAETASLEKTVKTPEITETTTIKKTNKIVKTTNLEKAINRPELSDTGTLKKSLKSTALAKTAIPEKAIKPVDTPKEKIAVIKPKLSEVTSLEKSAKHPELADTAALEEAVKHPKITETAAQEIAVNNTGSIQQEDWLLQQPSSHFTLQLLGSHNEKSLQGFIKKHNLPASQVAYYRGDHEGNDWYILVYGVYSNRDVATQQISKLPKALQTAKPWPRTLESVHTAIQQNSP